MPIELLEYELMRDLFGIVSSAALILLGTSAALGFGWLQAYRRARRAERTLAALERNPALEPVSSPERLERRGELRGSLDALAIEVERLAEMQRYQAKLLERLATGERGLPRAADAPRIITPH